MDSNLGYTKFSKNWHIYKSPLYYFNRPYARLFRASKTWSFGSSFKQKN